MGVLCQSNIYPDDRKSSLKRDNSRNVSHEEMKYNDDNDQMNVDQNPGKSNQMKLTDMEFERK